MQEPATPPPSPMDTSKSEKDTVDVSRDSMESNDLLAELRERLILGCYIFKKPPNDGRRKSI